MAEYSMVDGEKTHSWFMGFTNVDNPELVICVIVEGADGQDGAKDRSDCKADIRCLLLSIGVVKMQIKCYCNLYTDTGLKKRKNKILKALMERKPLSGISVIILAQGRQNHLEFFSALFLQQHFYDEKELFIVGIAEGKESAVALVGELC